MSYAQCSIPNCRAPAPATEAFCAKHREPHRIARPFAYCCAEAGGRVDACDCVNKNHGIAVYEQTGEEPR